MSCADIVNDWYRERLSSGAIARDTDAYNQLVAALPVLIERIDMAANPPLPLGDPPADPPAPKAKKAAADPVPDVAPSPAAA